MLHAIADFFSTWMGRLKAFSMLAGAWGVLFSVNSLIGFQAGFEYDDGLVYSTPAFQAAAKDKAPADSPDYWNSVNRSFSYERLKPVPWITAWTLRALGLEYLFSATAAAREPTAWRPPGETWLIVSTSQKPRTRNTKYWNAINLSFTPRPLTPELYRRKKPE